MVRRKKSIYRIVLTGVLFLLCVELVPVLGYLLSINLPERLSRNESSILQKQTDNRQTYVEDRLLSNQDLEELSDYIDDDVLRMIENGELNLSILNSDSEAYVALLQKISQSLIDTLREKRVTGIFVALNTQDMDLLTENAKFPGVYIRDLDPDSVPSERNADLMLERSPIQLVQSMNISTSKNWQPFIGKGTLNTANFIYPTFQAAYLDGGELEEGDYGHLTTATYTLRGDDRSALAYSIPLILPNGKVYGVLGIELLDDYVQSFLPAEELENERMGSYILACTNVEKLEGNVPVHVAVSSSAVDTLDAEELILTMKKESGHLSGRFTIDGKEYYSAVVPLNLYNRNTPFSDEQWLLIGTVPSGELFAFSNEIKIFLIVLFVVSIVLGLIYSIIFTNRLTHPIYQMYKQLLKSQEQPDKIPVFSPTNIKEMDQFSSAITSMSQEIIDTSTKFLRIIKMASVELAGYEVRYDTQTVYITENFFSMFDLPEQDPNDMNIVEFRMLLKEIDKLYTYSDYASGGKLYHITDEHGNVRYLHMKKAYYEYSQVGVIEDATATTLDQIRIRHERDHDLLTGIYNRRAVTKKYHALFKTPEVIKCAAVMMLDLDNLKHVNDTYGHAYGDKYIQAAGCGINKYLPANALYGRVSGDEFFAFLYGYDTKEELLTVLSFFEEAMSNQYMDLPNGDKKRISISGGIAWYGEDATDPEELKKCADDAMYQMKKNCKGKINKYKN